MKTILHLCVVAIFSFATLSCRKSVLPEPAAVAAPNTDPVIDSKIDRFIVEPTDMELGTASAIMHQGDRVTIFLPYAIGNETFASTTVTMTDDATGFTVGTYDLVSYTDPSASLLRLPGNLIYHPEFFFVTFIADENYTGKTVSVTTNLVGQNTSSTDVLSAAFSVIP